MVFVLRVHQGLKVEGVALRIVPVAIVEEDMQLFGVLAEPVH
jgi:hypothetical protein